MAKSMLTICPSRGRPDRIQSMLYSFFKTKSDFTNILVYVADDDPKLEEYIKVLNGVPYVIGQRRTIIDVFNYCVKRHPDYQFYSEINDDHVYRTEHWDDVLTSKIETDGKGWGIACGRELYFKDHFLPSGLVMSRNIIDVLGYFAYPLFQHTWIDVFWSDLGKSIGRYYFCPDVIIEHMHFGVGKAPMDDNYKFSMDQQLWQQGKDIYETWVRDYRHEDVAKIKTAMGE